MSVLARAFVLAFVACEVVLALFLTENSATNISTAVVMAGPTDKNVDAESAQRADSVGAGEGGEGDGTEGFENQDAWNRLFSDQKGWESEEQLQKDKPRDETDGKNDVCMCTEGDSLIHLSRGPVYVQAPTRIQPVQATRIQPVQVVSYTMPVQRAPELDPEKVYFYPVGRQPLPPRPPSATPIKVIWTPPPETRQCVVNQINPMEKKKIVETFFDNMDKLFNTMQTGKDQADKTVNNHALIKNILEALKKFTDLDNFITNNKALTFVLKLYDIIPKKQNDNGAIEPVIQTSNDGSPWDFIDDNGNVPALQEAWANLDQVPAIHHLAHAGAQVGSHLMHTGAMAAAHLAHQVQSQLQSNEFVSAVVHPHAIQHALDSDVVHGGVHAFVSHVDLPSAETVGPGTAHLVSTLSAKCGRNLVYQTMVTVASTMASLELNRRTRCLTFMTEIDPATLRERTDSGKYIFENTIAPLREIADTYQTACKGECEGDVGCKGDCEGDVDNFHGKVTDMIQKMKDILVNWLSSQFMGRGLRAPTNTEQTKRWSEISKQCDEYLVSLVRIVKERIPAFLDEWYDVGGSGTVWALNANYLSDFLDEKVMNSRTAETWDLFSPVYGLNDVHARVKDFIERAPWKEVTDVKAL